MRLRPLSCLASAVMLALLTGCGGEGASPGGGTDPLPPPPPITVDHRVTGEAIVKVRAAGSGWAALAEKLRPSFEAVMRPERRLLIADGATPGSNYAAPQGWSLLDFAIHPSREISVVIATDNQVRLLRLDRRGAVLTQTEFMDAAIPNDPYIGDPLFIPDHTALLPRATRDGVRLAAVGEELVMALHTGRNSILAYRFVHNAGAGASAGYARTWRSLVEPGVAVGGRATTTGLFDPFGSLYGQWQVLLDADSAGRIAVGINLYPSEYAEGHAQHFREALPAEFYFGALVTELAPDGRRVGTSYIDTRVNTEVKALKWQGNAIVAVGRLLPERPADGSGWDGLLSVIPAGHAGRTGYRAVDIDKGDVLLDVAPLPDGRLLAAGSTGYIQNPGGASISEEAKPLLAILGSDGSVREKLNLTAGPRHNQLRSLASWNGAWLGAGMENGPGTHSADADLSLLRADGYVRSLRLP